MVCKVVCIPVEQLARSWPWIVAGIVAKNPIPLILDYMDATMSSEQMLNVLFQAASNLDGRIRRDGHAP